MNISIMERVNKNLVGLIICLTLMLSSCAPDPPYYNPNCGTITNIYNYYDPYYGYVSQIYLNNGYCYSVPSNPNYYIGRYICF